MASMDKITIEILGDGTIKAETGEIGAANHVNAEAFMKFLAEKTAGKASRVHKGHHHSHTHEHEHEHEKH